MFGCRDGHFGKMEEFLHVLDRLPMLIIFSYDLILIPKKKKKKIISNSVSVL